MDEERWVERAREALDREAEGLDAATRSRLTRARSAAVEAAGRPARPRWLLAPALATALAVVAVAGFWNRPGEPAGAPEDTIPTVAGDQLVADLEILSADEDLELLADLEFYLWLESELTPADAG